MASISGQADAGNGYQDATTNFSGNGARNYISDSGNVNTAGWIFDASALEAGDTTVVSAFLNWTWDTDHSITSTALTWDLEDNATPTQYSDLNLPRDAATVGSTVTDVTLTGSPSGADTSVDLATVFQALFDSQGPGNITNIGVIVGLNSANSQYTSIDGSLDITLDITVSGGAGDPEGKLISGKLIGGILMRGRLV